MDIYYPNQQEKAVAAAIKKKIAQIPASILTSALKVNKNLLKILRQILTSIKQLTVISCLTLLPRTFNRIFSK